MITDKGKVESVLFNRCLVRVQKGIFKKSIGR